MRCSEGIGSEERTHAGLVSRARVAVAVQEEVPQRLERQQRALHLVDLPRALPNRCKPLGLYPLHGLLQHLCMQLPQRRKEDVGEAEHERTAFGHAVRRELLDGGVEEEEAAVEDEEACGGGRVREACLDGAEEGVGEVPAGGWGRGQLCASAFFEGNVVTTDHSVP